MNDITVVFNGYKRPANLKEQFDAVTASTIPPKNIMYWQNSMPGVEYDNNYINKCISSMSNTNFGVWSRFYYALNARTNWVCIFDDDTIPGKKWLENCYNTIQTHEGLLGTIGVIFNDLEYQSYTRYGWANPNNKIEEVDIVGHSWFFKREWLGAYWRDCDLPLHYLSGEDVHFSYAIQKFLNLKTYVPPHPENDKEMWGSQYDTAMKLGVDNVAISCNYHGSHFGKNLLHYKNKGFKYINNL